jgi:hypothetical protein
MNKLKPFLSSLAMGLLITAGLIMSGCTKEGPQGPAGEDGADGADGLDGEEQCGTCHDMSTDVKARILQWENSGHALNGNFERNGASCAGCHTNEGFNDVLENNGEDMIASATMSNPTPVGCRTCHKIHETYTPSDWQLKGADPVTLIVGGETDQGTGNTCANCHQARDAGIIGSTPGEGEVTITSPYWGPHHGTQANMIAADGGFEIPGDMSYTTGPHSSMEGGCVTCHMAEPYGVQSGGHQMAMGYAYHGSTVPNTAGCEDCHEGIESFDFAGTQTDVQEMLDELEVELLARGLMDEDHHAVPGTYPTNEAGAVYNFLFVKEDWSLGVHNHRYAKALLANTLADLQE